MAMTTEAKELLAAISKYLMKDIEPKLEEKFAELRKMIIDREIKNIPEA